MGVMAGIPSPPRGQIAASRLFDAVSTAFQPIVDIDTGAVIGHEALSRFTRDTVAVAPDSVFERASVEDRVEWLDALCLASALECAPPPPPGRPHTLFVNVEPASLLAAELPAALMEGRPVTVEITERALTGDPGGLLRAVERLRVLGHAIAIDDLGAVPASLALLPLIAPDVVKLDMSLVRDRPDTQVARVMTAVAGHAERTGALVLAEGVETEQQRVTARALGATLAQGWLFGRPVAADEAEHADPRAVAVVAARWAAGVAGTALSSAQPAPAPAAAPTPFDIVGVERTTRRADRALLVQVSTYLEQRAADGGDSAVLLATFQHESNITPATRRRYESLVAAGCLVTAYASAESAALPEPGRNLLIAEGDPLGEEWDVIVLTADHAAALIARETDASHHAEGCYDFVLTTDRDLVTRAARALLMRR
jgi:EAL domain-containing protein (putative c-di-GMP-specific phosphodiesterase class I)